MLAVLELAVARSLPPTRMPGYGRTLDIWIGIAESLRASDGDIRHLIGIYQDAALRACEQSGVA